MQEVHGPNLCNTMRMGATVDRNGVEGSSFASASDRSVGFRPANDNESQAANDNLERDVRVDMDKRLTLPRSLVDWFTGKPLLDGRSKPVKTGPISLMAADVLAALLAAGVTIVAMSATPNWSWLVVPWAMLVQTGRLRKMQTLYGHEAAHNNLFIRSDPRRSSARGARLNHVLGEIATTFALSQNVRAYRADHDLHHNITTYTTDLDPDTIYILRAGDFPLTLLDPRQYMADFSGRLRTNLWADLPGASPDAPRRPNWARRMMAWVWVSILIGSLGFLSVPAWIAAVFLPWVVLFRVAGVLQMLTLHAWRMPTALSFHAYAERTWARFSGVPLPSCGLSGYAWLKSWVLWWMEILFLELPFRLGVLSPDLQAHDVHHLEWILAFDMKALPDFIDDWRNQPFRRAEVIRDSRDPLGMARREFWGVRAMWRIAKANLINLHTPAW